MQNIFYNTIKCLHRGIYKIQWELGQGKEHLPGETGATARTKQPLSWHLPMTRNLPCRPAGKGKGTHRCTDTEAQQNFKGASEVSFLEANGNGDSSRVRLQLQDQSLLTILPIVFFFFETDSSACLITCNRRSAGEPCSHRAYILRKRQRINQSNTGFRIPYRETGYWK